MEKVIIHTIEKESDGLKIESVLKNRINFSAALITKLKRDNGALLLNGREAKTVERVKTGDVLKITVAEKKSENIIPIEMALDILYEDEDILVLNKPRSMPVHPVRNHLNDTLANGVVNHLGEDTRIHVITRLDKDTSGVVLFAKNSVAAAFLSEEMKYKRIKKEYVAIINGWLDPPSGEISAPIKKKEERGILRHISPDGKEAVTEYETLQKWEDFSLVKLIPITGRTHQLRVHMSYMGNPIYGDSMYGAKQIGERTRLHCNKIVFIHPESKEKITITAPIPEDIEKV